MEINVKENRLVRRIGKKFIRMLLLLVTVSIVTFTLVSMSPIDPLQANVGQAALGAMSQEQKDQLLVQLVTKNREKLLDKGNQAVRSRGIGVQLCDVAVRKL